MKKLNFVEKIRIRLKPRFKKITTSCIGFPITMNDKSSFLHMYEEIIENEIYKFKSNSDKPRILDCGANIGLSVIYFKKLYPQSRITAFEPDPIIFEILDKNIKSGQFNDVQLIRKGLSDKNGIISFLPNGSDGGKLSTEKETPETIQVETANLSMYLSEKINFLKIDIEGEEVKVLEECQNLLKNVDNIFVEYHSFTNCDQELHKLLKILHDSGFRYFIHPVGETQKQPLLQKRVYMNMDLQLNIFAQRS